MLTPEQRSKYADQGYVLLPGAFDRRAAQAVADRVWEYLEAERGVLRDDPETWNVPGAWVGLKTLREQEPYLSLDSLSLRGSIDELLGAENWHARDWGGFLISFPDCQPETWSRPADGWHVDFHYTHEAGKPFAVHTFVFLSEVGPRAGGTLVVRGSHRLVERFVRGLTPEQRAQKYSLLKKQFNASDPWLAELTAGDVGATGRADRFQECVHEIHGVPVCVDDLRGSPGDVILTHPWMLHATSPNAGDRPRIMLGKNIYTDPAVVNYG